MSVQDPHHKVLFTRLGGKRVEAAFDGGLLTSDSGVMLLREVEARVGISDRIVKVVGDRRHPGYVAHPLADLVRQRVFQMAEDANDCNALRQDAAFKAQAKVLYQESGQPVQLFTSFPYQAHTWAGPQRILKVTGKGVSSTPSCASICRAHFP